CRTPPLLQAASTHTGLFQTYERGREKFYCGGARGASTADTSCSLVRGKRAAPVSASAPVPARRWFRLVVGPSKRVLQHVAGHVASESLSVVASGPEVDAGVDAGVLDLFQGPQEAPVRA